MISLHLGYNMSSGVCQVLYLTIEPQCVMTANVQRPLLQQLILQFFFKPISLKIKMTTIRDLPEEVVLNILNELTRRGLFQCQAVCRSWRTPSRCLTLREVRLWKSTANSYNVQIETLIPRSSKQSNRFTYLVQIVLPIQVLLEKSKSYSFVFQIYKIFTLQTLWFYLSNSTKQSASNF